MRRLAAITVLALAALLLASTPTFAQWPTTCVEFNDIVESVYGNYDNLGLYQKTYGDQAEQACRAEHRAGVRQAFRWLIDDFEGEQTSAVTIIVPALEPPLHAVAYYSIRDIALARGASETTARAVAALVAANGDTEAFHRGELASVPYGLYNCRWNSPQCPLGRLRDYQIINTEHEWGAEHSGCRRLHSKFEIVNNTQATIRFDWINLDVTDLNGRVVHRETLHDRNVPAYSLVTFTVSWDFCGELAALAGDFSGHQLWIDPQRAN